MTTSESVRSRLDAVRIRGFLVFTKCAGIGIRANPWSQLLRKTRVFVAPASKYMKNPCTFGGTTCRIHACSHDVSEQRCCRGRRLWAVEVHAGRQNAVRVGVFSLCTRMRPNQVLEGVVIVRFWPAHMPPKRYRARRL